MPQRELWYVAERRDGCTTMRLYKAKRHALKAAWQILHHEPHIDVEVGPMLETEGVLRGDELRKVAGARLDL